jgi:hypothetical protein
VAWLDEGIMMPQGYGRRRPDGNAKAKLDQLKAPLMRMLLILFHDSLINVMSSFKYFVDF